jgi:hypothetical protein
LQNPLSQSHPSLNLFIVEPSVVNRSKLDRARGNITEHVQSYAPSGMYKWAQKVARRSTSDRRLPEGRGVGLKKKAPGLCALISTVGVGSHNINERGSRMRLEITSADERPEAKILSSVSDPSGFMLDLVRRFGQIAKPAARPDYAAAIEQIRQSPHRFKTKEEIDAYVNQLRNEW